MADRKPKIWARVDPELRERVRLEAHTLYGGNESLLVRKAIVRFLDELDERRRRALDASVAELIEASEVAVA